MGSGFVLTYVLIAAMVAPVVWVAWWAVASLGDSRRRPFPVAAVGRSAAIGVPHPIDGNFPGRIGEIVIRRMKDGLEVGACHGPDGAGRCPRALADGTVPCAGAALALSRPVRGSLEWHIPAGYRSCMLGSYSTFTQRESR